MDFNEDIETIKALLRKHAEFTKLWHLAFDDENWELKAEIDDELSSIERDITFIARDIFGEDN